MMMNMMKYELDLILNFFFFFFFNQAPNNDYSQHFVNTGQRPQNYIRDAALKISFFFVY